MIRLLLLEVVVSEQGWLELCLQSRKEIGAAEGALAERIHELRRRYLCKGSFSPASSIILQLARRQATGSSCQKPVSIGPMTAQLSL
jgi:hypothetical protein